jgi:type VI secretion system protein ImpM
MNSQVRVGLFGKHPGDGEFLRRRLSAAFTGRWDNWLQQSIAASSNAAGGNWLALYVTSPPWRFVCSPHAVTQHCVLGVMLPSLDRSGQFPLTIVCELPDWAGYAPSPAAIAVQCADWFEAVEQLANEALATQAPDFEQFDSRVARSATLLESLLAPPEVLLHPDDARDMMEDPRGTWHIPLSSTGSLSSVVEQLTYARLDSRPGPVVLWWTNGSERVTPCCLVAGNLPDPAQFTSFLDGQWKTRGVLRSVHAIVTEGQEPEGSATVQAQKSIRYVSAGRTDRGLVRPSNQDAFLERPGSGIWVVADGMGGYERGELASLMVCDGLLKLPPETTLEATSLAVRYRLSDINSQLHRMATRWIAPIKSGTTVVVLMTHGQDCEVLWAGDSRAYRLRDDRLEALTKDHVWEGFGGALGEKSTTITRAVGGAAHLDLDTWRGSVRPGDRYMLCSDGITRSLDESAIRHCLLMTDLQAAAHALIEEAIGAGSSDNVTAVVIEAGA